MNAAEWAKENTIYMTLAGSWLYGTQREDSDIDWRGVCLDPPAAILGMQGFEQYQDLDEDRVIYGVRKFLRMCLDANPSILDILFAPLDKAKVYKPEWFNIHHNRHKFLSQKVRHTFSGYAFSQLKRIERHKRWIDNPPERVGPGDFGLLLYSTARGGQRLEPIPQRYKFVLSNWPYLDINNIKASVRRRSIYVGQDRTAMISAYKQAKSEYDKYTEWIKNRNEYRAELETKYGYDVKHASHLARLLMKGIEILSTGDYNPVLSGEQLEIFNDIKNGVVKYEDLVSWAKKADNAIRRMDTVLPKSPDRFIYEELVTRYAAISLRQDARFVQFLTGGVR